MNLKYYILVYDLYILHIIYTNIIPYDFHTINKVTFSNIYCIEFAFIFLSFFMFVMSRAYYQVMSTGTSLKLFSSANMYAAHKM